MSSVEKFGMIHASIVFLQKESELFGFKDNKNYYDDKPPDEE